MGAAVTWHWIDDSTVFSHGDRITMACYTPSAITIDCRDSMRISPDTIIGSVLPNNRAGITLPVGTVSWVNAANTTTSIEYANRMAI